MADALDTAIPGDRPPAQAGAGAAPSAPDPRDAQARRLDALADQLLRAGDARAALRAATEAQALALAQVQEGHQRSLDLLRQGLEVEQAERERLISEQHALRLERQRGELAQTLQRQHELHAELVEARKLAGLGELLRGLSGALDAPLREAARQAGEARLGIAPWLARVGTGNALRRSELQQALQAGLQAGSAALQRVEQAHAELQRYRSLRDEA